MQIKKVQSEKDIYDREKLLGEGAFGKAYLVKQKSTGIRYVIKQMNIAEMSQTEQNETFKEAKILEALHHPNIVKFKQVYVTTNQKLNIVMEYADGGDLSKKIKQQKASQKLFDEPTILDWFTQMCLAIKHVHDRKIIHRDIKGQNIFITKSNTVKLGDFGIARILNKTMEKARTVVGTPYYLSPEIIQNKPYSNKSDIWSMGVVLYQLCALAPPFNANSLQFLALKIVKGSYNPITGPYSKQLKTLISDMLNLNPERRPSADSILKLPFIVSRIQKFLTQTQNKVQFSHTILHDFKLGLNKDKKTIQSQHQSAESKQQVDAKQVERERMLLKQKQMEYQRLRQQKKKQQKAIQERRRKQEEQARIQKIQMEQRKKQQNRKFQQKQEELREQQARLEYQRYKQYQEKDRLNKDKKKEAAERARIQQQQKQRKYRQFAKQEFFRNKAIKQNAERRAKQNNYPDFQEGNSFDPISVEHVQKGKVQGVVNLPKPNFHYKKESQILDNKAQQHHPVSNQNQKKYNQKPSIGYKQRPSSRQKPITNKYVQPKVDDQMLMNAFVNPNFQKKQQQKQAPTTDKPLQRQNKEVYKKQPTKKEQKKQDYSKKNTDLKRIMEEGRAKRRNNQKQQQAETQESEYHSEPLPKQAKQRQALQSPSAKKQSPIRDPKQQLKTIRGNKWNKQEKSVLEIVSANTKQIYQIMEQNRLLEDMLNKDIQKQQQSQQQLNDVIKQYQKIIGNVAETVEQLPSIHEKITDNQRKDDFTEPEKDSQFQQKTIYQKEGLQYFSDYSKLQSLRMSLEDVFGTDTFVRLYRIIEKQFQTHGIQGLEHDAIRKKVDFIDQNLFSQYITMLMTLIVIQNKVNEQSV